jgi:hypothetical protein
VSSSACQGLSPAELFGAWRTFWEALASTAPVILMFEDLHGADTGTLDFIEHLMDWSRNEPIFIISLARPELLDRRPDWGAARRSLTSVFLEPLGEPSMRELLRGLVPDLPEATTPAIVERAEASGTHRSRSSKTASPRAPTRRTGGSSSRTSAATGLRGDHRAAVAQYRDVSERLLAKHVVLDDCLLDRRRSAYSTCKPGCVIRVRSSITA